MLLGKEQVKQEATLGITKNRIENEKKIWFNQDPNVGRGSFSSSSSLGSIVQPPDTATEFVRSFIAPSSSEVNNSIAYQGYFAALLF